MKKTIILLLLAVTCGSFLHAQSVQKVDIPIGRQGIHDNIDKEQATAVKFDGKADDLVKVSEDQTINLQVTNAIVKQVDDMQMQIELDSTLDHRLKMKYLTGLYTTLHDYNQKRAYHKIAPEEATDMITAYKAMMHDDINGQSILPEIQGLSYEAGDRLVEFFKDNPGYKDARGVLFKKYAFNNLSTVMPIIGAYLDYPVDSVIAAVARKYPNQVLTYATSTTPVAAVIRKNPDPIVQLIVQIGNSGQPTLILPFIDELMAGTTTIDKLSNIVSDEDLYFKQLVKSAIALQHRRNNGEQVIGLKAMMENLQARSLRYIREVDDLHEEPAPVRFKVVKNFTPEELYYLIVNGQEELYTSSYTNHDNAGLYDQMMIRLKPPRGDSLLMLVEFDRFKRFIAMAAGFNTLDNFLKSMNPDNANYLMKKYVSSLEKTEDLEDAVDVANSFGSIRDPKLLAFLREEVQKNYQYVAKKKDHRGMVIYELLASLFDTETEKGGSDSSKASEMAAKLQLPPINFVDFSSLTSDSGRVYQQVFFYGDKDGHDSYVSFMSNFPGSEWRVTKNKYWTTIVSTKGKPITIYANLPLEEPDDKDAIEKLSEYLDENDIHPTVFIHRGHSYHVETTLDNLQSSARIVVLGSCGGYHNLAVVLQKAPEAHIISSKQVGTRFVNEPIIRTLDETIRSGKNVDWVKMWASLAARFAGDARNKELFSDYVPPHKNLGAIFIKAYTQIMKDDKIVQH